MLCKGYMTALKSLIEEHQFLSRLATALEAYSQRVRQGLDADLEDLRRFAAAFTQFGDHLHHEKEERILLPFLSRHGFDWNGPPLPLIRQQHRQELYLLDVLRQAGERLTRWSDEERRHVFAAARAWCELQREHHAMENVELFPQVSIRLDAHSLHLLEQELERFDREPQHREARAAVLALGAELIERYASSAVNAA